MQQLHPRLHQQNQWQIPEAVHKDNHLQAVKSPENNETLVAPIQYKNYINSERIKMKKKIEPTESIEVGIAKIARGVYAAVLRNSGK